MNPIALKNVFAPSVHLCEIVLNSTKPSLSQMYLRTLDPFKSYPFKLECTFAPSNQTLFNSNMYLHLQTTQIKSFSNPVCLCIFKLFKYNPLQLECAYASSNKPLKSILLKFDVFLHPQITQIKSFSTQMCLCTSNHSIRVLFNSNMLMYPQTIEIKSFSTQMYLCTFKLLESSPL